VHHDVVEPVAVDVGEAEAAVIVDGDGDRRIRIVVLVPDAARVRDVQEEVGPASASVSVSVSASVSESVSVSVPESIPESPAPLASSPQAGNAIALIASAIDKRSRIVCIVSPSG
jgi:hypothetical protein